MDNELIKHFNLLLTCLTINEIREIYGDDIKELLRINKEEE